MQKTVGNYMARARGSAWAFLRFRRKKRCSCIHVLHDEELLCFFNSIHSLIMRCDKVIGVPFVLCKGRQVLPACLSVCLKNLWRQSFASPSPSPSPSYVYIPHSPFPLLEGYGFIKRSGDGIPHSHSLNSSLIVGHLTNHVHISSTSIPTECVRAYMYVCTYNQLCP